MKRTCILIISILAVLLLAGCATSARDWWEDGERSYYNEENDRMYVVAYNQLSNRITSRIAAEELAIQELGRNIAADLDGARSLMIGDGGAMFGNTQAIQDLDVLTFTDIKVTLVGIRTERSYVDENGGVYVEISAPYEENLNLYINGALGEQDFEPEAAAVYANILHDIAYGMTDNK